MHWYCCIVGINQEMLAQRGLVSKGFEVYCPIGKRVVRHARQQNIRTFPVFSRYIFAKFDPQNHQYAIREANGVIDIITNDSKPIEISCEIIDDIKQRESKGEFDILPPVRSKKRKWAKSFDILKSLLNIDAMIQV